jgi:hypothetical protein
MNNAIIKEELIEWLKGVDDDDVLEKIAHLKKWNLQFKSKLSPMSPESYKAILDQAEQEFFDRNIISQEDLENEIKNW